MTLETLLGANDLAPGNPNATDPGVTNSTPTSGGKATPDDAIFQGPGDALRDNSSLDDDGGLPTSNPGFVGNQDTGVTTPHEEHRDTPVISAGLNTAPDDFSGVPTGGLQADGTIGGIPTGNVGTGS